MNADEAYAFHQTPAACAAALVALVPIEPGDILAEPFRGEGAFFNAFPSTGAQHLWAEERQGRDYKDISGAYDWVITNPPFRLEVGGKRVNSFWFLLDYYSQRARKGVAFLGNDRCFSVLTPKRVALLASRGWGITKLVVASIKKWRGRYYFVIFERKPSVLLALPENYV
jgi:hypothetical protein